MIYSLLQAAAIVGGSFLFAVIYSVYMDFINKKFKSDFAQLCWVFGPIILILLVLLTLGFEGYLE